MTTFNNLRTTEPAFVSYEKSVIRSANGSHKRLSDCCFSFSNLALIVSIHCGGSLQVVLNVDLIDLL